MKGKASTQERETMASAKKKVTAPVPMSQFGPDHWTTLLYLKHRIVDAAGATPDREKMRTDMKRHPQMAGLIATMLWKSGGRKQYPTRLRNGTFLHHHDDWDCADDLVAAALLTSTGTGAQPTFELTQAGWMMTMLLEQHRAAGRRWDVFVPLVRRGGVLVEALSAEDLTTGRVIA